MKRDTIFKGQTQNVAFLNKEDGRGGINEKNRSDH